MFGVDSRACGEVDTFDTLVDKSKGRARLKNVGSDFVLNEKVISVDETGGDPTIWTSSGKPSAYFSFQGDTVSSQTTTNYRLATKLIVSVTGGDDSEAYNQTSWTEDMNIIGAAGSTATLHSWTNSGVGGGTAELWVTNLIGSTSAGEYGFTADEALWPDGVPSGSYESHINTVEPPQFVMGSGKMLFISNVEPVNRNSEQSEELKLTIDLANC